SEIVRSYTLSLHDALPILCALWGPLHGGANVAVLEMLDEISRNKVDVKEYVQRVKTDKNTRLMGFGHRVYKNFDPRATILKKARSEEHTSELQSREKLVCR